MMSTPDQKDTEKRNPGYDESDSQNDNQEQTSGETSSVADLDRSGFTKHPQRKNTPLGASHEPGTAPGTE
ncbi:MAG: hypothetical protein V4594_16545 [Bacteroidota bacterium]